MRNHGKSGERLVLTAILAFLAAFLFCGCSGKTTAGKDVPQSENLNNESSMPENGSTEADKESENTERTEISGESENASDTESAVPPEDIFVQQKIVVATDIHYLAEEFSGNRCESFMDTVLQGDGQVLQYGWEILDAFIDDMLEEKPDLVVLSGDLTLNGEKKSHEELAGKLDTLLENDIPVAVIPGNHDINNPQAKRFTDEGPVAVESVTPEEFAEIYADFGYAEAEARDPASLSYLYRLDDYYWLLMLDTCQYTPANQIGGMIGRDTYKWIEDQLSEAWTDGAQVITVTHHNLLDQSGVSRVFYDNCTIEHNEQLIQTLYDGQVRLHMSGHLHLQHYMQDPDSEIYEIVTSSLVMSPCHYGVLKIMENGSYVYDAHTVDVDGWAKRNDYKNKDLSGFTNFCEMFLKRIAYKDAVEDLRRHTLERKLFLSDVRIEKMAKFYAELCVYYYEGRVYEIWDSLTESDEFRYWNEVEYISELSDFLRNILNDEAKDFSHLEIPY